ncbi:MAG: protein translocase subunit SecD [candidate division Zixibacteria bacterium]|nr:protein translocase subunit SecD [candidate division Zixibacteria bacterium]
MGQGQGWKIGLTAFLLLGSLWYLYPTARLLWMDPAERDQLAQSDPAGWINLQQKAMKLGLDLKGGMRVVLEVDKSKLNPDEAKDAVDRAKEILRNRVDQFGVTEPVIQVQGEDRIVVELPGISDVSRARELIGRTALLEFKLTEPPEQASLLVDRIDRSLEAAAGVDTSTASPTDTTKKDAAKTDALKELFSSDSAKKAADTSLANKPAGDTSVLPPQIPKQNPLSSLLDPGSGGSGWSVNKDDVPSVKNILARPEVTKLIPPDVAFAWGTKPQFQGGTQVSRLYLLKRQTEMSGKYLTDARPSFDQFRKPIVNFQLTREGGRMFARLTGANIKKPLAIVLDGNVESAPEIQSRIQDRGQITMGSATSYDEANDLAIVLRAGALPAPVNIIENNVVGPSLGQDSIHRGLTASLIAAAIVFLIMAIYYQLSGLIADFALLLNAVFLLGVMAALHSTLTMPGIAGIILTIGISVDSNVLIFERIREEMRAGKAIRNAIDAGYAHAIAAIIDSHVTTLITALVLYIFGTGPIRGFAVTLFAGVAISLFTAVVVTRAVFDIRKTYQTLSI